MVTAMCIYIHVYSIINIIILIEGGKQFLFVVLDESKPHITVNTLATGGLHLHTIKPQ